MTLWRCLDSFLLFHSLGFTGSKFSFLYLIWTCCMSCFWWIILCFALLIRLNYLTLLARLLPLFQPLCPERCDVGSFKLLGWTLAITGTWNCLIHADLHCTSACQQQQKSLCTRPARNLAQLLSTVEEFSVFFFFAFFKCNLLCNVMDNTNCSSFRFVATCKWKTHVFFPFFWIWNSKWIHCGFPMCYSSL